ncbi:MAG: hypothetical protein ACPGWR_18880 [Ardenticatenaceae bacterium]
MITRPRKVEVVVLGRGLAAAALADGLAQAGRRVALLVEEPGWERGIRPAWEGWHMTGGPEGVKREALAAEGAKRLLAWQEDGLPGIMSHALEDGSALWLLDYDQLLPALGARIAAGERCWVAEGTRVRGISVIEHAILGAIAEDARYDARQLINAAEGKRYASFARMMRRPHSLDLAPFPPTASGPLRATKEGQAAYPNATPFPRDRSHPLMEETTVKGGWRIRGVAGWPLLALGIVSQYLQE